MVILSGTRGIWAAAIGVPFIGLGAVAIARHTASRARMMGYVTSWMAVFFVLFALAWPVATSPQFLLQKLDADLFGARLRSVIDFGETSNSARIAIWRATIDSIAERPLLGVGPANFPIILEQDIRMGRAGSSAHNLWLHLAAESGIPAALLFITLYIALWRRAWRVALQHADPMLASSMMWAVLSLPWIAAYLLTDAALLDERMLLQFGTLAACISALDA
jgi:O-antigen ligase